MPPVDFRGGDSCSPGSACASAPTTDADRCWTAKTPTPTPPYFVDANTGQIFVCGSPPPPGGGSPAPAGMMPSYCCPPTQCQSSYRSMVMMRQVVPPPPPEMPPSQFYTDTVPSELQASGSDNITVQQQNPFQCGPASGQNYMYDGTMMRAPLDCQLPIQETTPPLFYPIAPELSGPVGADTAAIPGAMMTVVQPPMLGAGEFTPAPTADCTMHDSSTVMHMQNFGCQPMLALASARCNAYEHGDAPASSVQYDPQQHDRPHLLRAKAQHARVDGYYRGEHLPHQFWEDKLYDGRLAVRTQSPMHQSRPAHEPLLHVDPYDPRPWGRLEGKLPQAVDHPRWAIVLQGMLRDQQKNSDGELFTLPALAKIQAMLLEVLPDFDRLCQSRFGSHVLRSLVRECTSSQRLAIWHRLGSQGLADCAIHDSARWVLKELLHAMAGGAGTFEQIAAEAGAIATFLQPHIIRLLATTQANGNGFIRDCVQILHAPQRQFLYNALSQEVICQVVADHPFGSSVLQDCLLYGAESQVMQLVRTISSLSATMAKGCCSTYLLHAVLKSSNREHRLALLFALDGSFAQLAMHKRGSKVVKEALNCMTGFRIVATELLETNLLKRVMFDCYGNLVIQQLLDGSQSKHTENSDGSLDSFGQFLKTWSARFEEQVTTIMKRKGSKKLCQRNQNAAEFRRCLISSMQKRGSANASTKISTKVRVKKALKRSDCEDNAKQLDKHKSTSQQPIEPTDLESVLQERRGVLEMAMDCGESVSAPQNFGSNNDLSDADREAIPDGATAVQESLRKVCQELDPQRQASMKLIRDPAVAEAGIPGDQQPPSPPPPPPPLFPQPTSPITTPPLSPPLSPPPQPSLIIATTLSSSSASDDDGDDTHDHGNCTAPHQDPPHLTNTLTWADKCRLGSNASRTKAGEGDGVGLSCPTSDRRIDKQAWAISMVLARFSYPSPCRHI
jgi:hypothetical protein